MECTISIVFALGRGNSEKFCSCSFCFEIKASAALGTFLPRKNAKNAAVDSHGHQKSGQPDMCRLNLCKSSQPSQMGPCHLQFSIYWKPFSWLYGPKVPRCLLLLPCPTGGCHPPRVSLVCPPWHGEPLPVPSLQARPGVLHPEETVMCWSHANTSQP